MSQPKLLYRITAKQASALAIIAVVGLMAILSVFFLISDLVSNSYATSVESEVTAEIDGTHYVTLSAPDVTFSITPTDSAQLSKQNINVNVETNASGGADLYLAMSGNTNALHLNGDTTSTAPAIEATTSSVAANSLAANTWGYSTDDETYSAVPTSNSAPALLAAVDGSSVGSNAGGVTSASIPVYFAASVDTSIPSGSYANSVTYSAVVDGGIITSATLTKIEIGGAEVENMQPEVENTLLITTNLMTNTYGTPRVYYEATSPAGYQECGDVVVSRNESGYMTITCKVTPTQAATGVTLHIVPKGSADDRFCTDNTYQPDTSDCEAGEWKWGSFVVEVPDIVKPINGLLDITNMQEMTPEICSKSAEGDTKQLVDIRDGKKYWIAKLADGNCWMTQNLDLDLQAGMELTPDNTDIDSNWDPGATTFTRGKDGSENDNLVQSWDMGVAVWKTPDSLSWCTPTDNLYNSSCSAVWQNVSDGSLWFSLESIDADGDPVDSNTHTYDAHYLAGNHYSYLAATAGTGRNASSNYTIATGSICPKGWKLPTSGDRFDKTSGSFYNLFEHYGINTSGTGPMDINLMPLYFVRAGNIRPTYNLNLAGSNADYYSSVAYSSTQAYYMDSNGPMGIAKLNASNWHSRYLGFSIRCVTTSS